MNQPVIGAILDWDWVGRQLDTIGVQLVEHVQLTAIAVGVGFVISFPLAVFAYRHKRFYAPITWVTGVLYTIPSLALFILLIPYTGLSTATAEIGLVSYTLLILIRNIVAGLRAVPADVKEAAEGMGYTRRQILWSVELPLALPVIMAGVRIATVTTIGLVTVTALIGKGGLGFFILRGLRDFFPTASIVGAVLSVALAVVADGLLLLVQRFLTPWARAVKVRAFA
ncbi:MAG: ABC transporter permease [Actinobacteria bacterium]|nr:ABC transporter permease [Actinomycetota bacterium]